MNTSIQTLSFQNFPVSFRADGYLNATEIAEHFGKRINNYLRNERTQEYISALIEFLNIPETRNRATVENQLVITQKGGNDKSAQGTWLHPKLAIDFARWLNPKFAVWCDMQIEKILHQNSASPTTKTALPNGLTLEQQDEIKKLHRQLVQAAPKEKQAKLAIQLWSSVKSKFGVSYKEVAPEHYPEVLSLMARVAVEQNQALTGELLDKQPAPSALQLQEFELVRIMQLLTNRYMAMQTTHIAARAVALINPSMAKQFKTEFERDFPLLQGIVHGLQRFSEQLRDPLCIKEFELNLNYLQRANLAW